MKLFVHKKCVSLSACSIRLLISCITFANEICLGLDSHTREANDQQPNPLSGCCARSEDLPIGAQIALCVMLHLRDILLVVQRRFTQANVRVKEISHRLANAPLHNQQDVNRTPRKD